MHHIFNSRSYKAIPIAPEVRENSSVLNPHFQGCPETLLKYSSEQDIDCSKIFQQQPIVYSIE